MIDPDEVGERALAAIADLFAQLDPGAMVQRFVGVCEVVTEDGDRAVWTLAPPQAKPWDTLGLLEHARMMEQAG